MHITSTLSAGFLNFLLMHFLDYNNVGGVRWTSISELCIIEIYLLLAPHVNTINKYEACEGRCGTSHLGMVQPPPLPYIYTLLNHMLSRPCSH